MIHLKTNLTEEVATWLDDVTENKGENAQKKMMNQALRDVAINFETIYLKMIAEGSVKINEKVTVRKSDYQSTPFEDEKDGELVLGEKIIDRLQHAYFIRTKISELNLGINEWCRQAIVEAIITKKVELTKTDLENEEKEVNTEKETKPV